MLVGDANRRRSDDLDPNSAEARAVTFRCFNDDGYDQGLPGYAESDSFDLPKQTCSYGIRSNIYFPR